MSLKKENIIRQELLLNGEMLTIVYDHEDDSYKIARYNKSNDSFSKGESYDEKQEAYSAFLAFIRRIGEAYKVDSEAKFDTFFCESAPEWGRAVGMSHVHTFNKKMTIDEADDYLKENIILNPDNGKKYIRVKLPMLWSKKLKKYIYYEAVLEEELAKQSS